MAYELHIEREEQDISLDEWLEALQSVPNVREKVGDTVAVNPRTGEEIRIGPNDGDAEALIVRGGFFGIGRREEWITAFRFFEGKASFKATSDLDSPKSSLRIAAAQLAAALNATIVGDEGEEYDW